MVYNNKVDRPFPTVEEDPTIKQCKHIVKIRCRLCGEIAEKGMDDSTMYIVTKHGTVGFRDIKCPNRVDDNELIFYDVVSVRDNPDYDPNYKEE